MCQKQKTHISSPKQNRCFIVSRSVWFLSPKDLKSQIKYDLSPNAAQLTKLPKRRQIFKVAAIFFSFL
jgi:hypothetical protein